MTSAGSIVIGPALSQFGKDIPEPSLEKSLSTESGFLYESLEEDVSTKQNQAATQIQSSNTMKTRRKIHENFAEQDAKLESAATLIQAGFRSLKAKRSIQLTKSKVVEEDRNQITSDENVSNTNSIKFNYEIPAFREIDNELYDDADDDVVTSTIDLVNNEGQEEQLFFEESHPINYSENGADTKVEVRESSGKAVSVGAVPFHLQDSPQNSDNLSKQNEDEISMDERTVGLNINRESSIIKTEDKKVIEPEIQVFDPDTPIALYIHDKDAASETVQIFLREKKLLFSKTFISRKKKHQLLAEFLEINPAGILPTLLFNKHIIRYGAVKINNFLEENVPVDIYPMMIPCTTSPAVYQKYLFFTSQIQSINLTALEAGHLLYGREVDTTEAITHFDLQEEIKQMGQIAGL